ncbi:MAG TPA: histidine phosphatase family protein [Candidatus Saccharimonadales bacterium]|nr:histidine phosphatase family protein [Candidatus Saccharimonadales bacterium]
MRHLYLVRHGHTEMNEAGRFSGQTETHLTARGREQAQEAGKQAKALQLDLIVSSPLSRAHDTARIIAEEIGYPEYAIKLDNLLMERHFGSAEGVVYSREFDMESIADAEKLESLRSRLEQLWNKLQDTPAENILIVGHGSAGRMLRHVVLPHIPFHGTSEAHHLPNAEIIQLL